MKVVFYASEGHDLDRGLAAAFEAGCKRHDVPCETRWMKQYVGQTDADLAVCVGVKGRSKQCFQTHRAAGRHALIFDKGYTRLPGGPFGTLYWRSSIDEFQPLKYLYAFDLPDDRWKALKLDIVPWRPTGPHRREVLFCGSSQKYCNWHDLGPATDYAKGVFERLRAVTKRPLAYRPKPSWRDAVPIEGTRYSTEDERFESAVKSAFVVVTYGSNAAFEALLRGVPAVVLGDGIARPLARTSLDDVESPYKPAVAEVRKLACNVAYQQWSVDEVASGAAWEHFRRVIKHLEA